MLGCIGGGKWTGSPTTLGPSIPTGSPGGVTSLAKAKQVIEMSSAVLLHTFGTIFHDSLHICIYGTSSHILTHNIKKCYTDYFLCRLIYAYPYAINLTYYDTMVLITKNNFSHLISELGTSYCKCQADMM